MLCWGQFELTTGVDALMAFLAWRPAAQLCMAASVCAPGMLLEAFQRAAQGWRVCSTYQPVLNFVQATHLLQTCCRPGLSIQAQSALKSLQRLICDSALTISACLLQITMLKQAQSAFSKPQPQQPGETPGPSYVETCRSVLAEAIANQVAAAPSSMGPPAQVPQQQQQAPPQPQQQAAPLQQQQVPSKTPAYQQQQQQPRAVQTSPQQPQQTHTVPAPGQAGAGAGLRGQAMAMTPAPQLQQPVPQPQSVMGEDTCWAPYHGRSCTCVARVL